MRRITLATLVAAAAAAGGSRTFRLSSFADFDAGEPDGARIGTTGEVRPGFGKTRVAVTAQSVWSAVRAPDGSVWLGTGDEGRVLRLRGDEVSEVAKLDAVLVTSLVAGDGVIYAGTLPGGRVFALDRDGKARELAKLESEHVWALVWDGARKTLFAATGPDGKLWAIDTAGGAGGKARVFFDSKQKHLLSLVPDGKGGFFAGSADEAILYRIDRDGRGFALHDFAGSEVRALARDAAGALYAAVNDFEKAAAPPPPPPPKEPAASGGATPAPPPAPTPPQARPGAKGKGTIYRIESDGTVEPVYPNASWTFHALDVDADGAVWAATAAEGRVLMVLPDHTAYTLLDFDEKQALVLWREGDTRLVGTGDGAAVYRVAPAPPDEPVYRSKVLDAGSLSDWGQLRWRATGGAVEMDARSGNTKKPDDTWSGWKPTGGGGRGDGETYGRVASPPARYLQVRARFAKGSAAALREIVAYYQPRNRRARVTEIATGEEKKESGAAAGAGSGTGAGAGAGSGAGSGSAAQPRKPVIKLHWKVDNPDGDALVYRLWFREESEVTWRPLGGPDPLEKSEYEWNTESIADGTYRVKVVASDERANSEARRREHFLVSDPILVDNRKPDVLGVALKGGVAAGRAVDTYSPVEQLDYALDGGPFAPLAPLDGMLDDLVEAFRVDLPKDLAPGAHTLAVRATDAAGNVGVAQVGFRVP